MALDPSELEASQQPIPERILEQFGEIAERWGERTQKRIDAAVADALDRHEQEQHPTPVDVRTARGVLRLLRDQQWLTIVASMDDAELDAVFRAIGAELDRRTAAAATPEGAIETLTHEIDARLGAAQRAEGKESA